MAELGTTSDPRALVPGDPASAEGLSAALTARAARADEAADELAAVRVPSWRGEAADAFDEVMAAQPRSWRIAADALSSAARHLSDFAEALAAAQSEAGRAIALWNEAEAATEQAAQAREDALLRYQQAAAGGMSPVMLGPFTDPGGPGRCEAQAVLDAARDAVSQAGDAAAAGITRIEVTDRWLLDGGTSSEWLTASGSAGGSLFRWDPRKGEGHWGLASASGEATIWKGRAWGEAKRGGTTLSGEVSAQLGAEGDAKVGIQDGTVQLGASGRAGVTVEGKGSMQNEGGTVELSVDGSAGVAAEAGVAAGRNGITSKNEVFVGGKAGSDLSGEIGPVDVTGRVEAWRGYGLKADWDFGRNDKGEWEFGGAAGAARGQGVGWSLHFTVDPDDLWAGVQHVLPFLSETRQ